MKLREWIYTVALIAFITGIFYGVAFINKNPIHY